MNDFVIIYHTIKINYLSRKSDSNRRVFSEHDYKSSGVDRCPIPANKSYSKTSLSRISYIFDACTFLR